MALNNSEKNRAALESGPHDKSQTNQEYVKVDTSFRGQLARIMQATESTSDADLARALGISQPSVWGVKNKGRIPDSWIKKIADKYAVSTDWLYNGGPDYKAAYLNALYRMYSKHGQHYTDKNVEEHTTKVAVKEFTKFSKALPYSPEIDSIFDKYINDIISQRNTPPTEEQPATKETDVDMMFIPLVEARLSAGTGSLETSADGECKYAFRSDFLRRKGSPSNMVLMRVSGDSMEPEIKDGDVVLLDQGKTTILPGRMYAVGIEEAIYVKQIDTIPGKLILKSMNQAYPPIEVDMRCDLAEQTRVIGQVLWVGREYR